MPLMPIDRHVERVVHRVGLLPPKATVDEAHDLFLGVFQPDEMYEAHVNLIQHGRKVCHAQRPDHDACPLRARCRFVDPKAPVGQREGQPPPWTTVIDHGPLAAISSRKVPAGASEVTPLAGPGSSTMTPRF